MLQVAAFVSGAGGPFQITVVVLSLLLAALAVPPVRALAIRIGAIDHAGDARRVHGRSVPRLGGVAMAMAIFIVLALAKLCGAIPWGAREQTVLLGGIAILVLGILDDTSGTAANLKLLAQVGTALFVAMQGVRLELVQLPWIGAVHLGAFAVPTTVFFLVGIMNAVNLIDGLDGLAGGLSCISAAALLLSQPHAAPLVTVICLAIIGSTLGFLIFNFNPASIFMGDAGSLLLGYLLGVCALGLTPSGIEQPFRPLVVAFALMLPIVDTTLAIGRRLLCGRPVFCPDRDHIHHRLLAKGLSQRRVVLRLYMVAGLAAVAAVGIGHSTWRLGGWLVGVAALIGLARALDFKPGSIWRAHARASDARLRNRRFRYVVGESEARLTKASTAEELRAVLGHFGESLGERVQVRLIPRDGRSTVRWPTRQDPRSGTYGVRNRQGDTTHDLWVHWPEGRATVDLDADRAILGFCGALARCDLLDQYTIGAGEGLVGQVARIAPRVVSQPTRMPSPRRRTRHRR